MGLAPKKQVVIHKIFLSGDPRLTLINSLLYPAPLPAVARSRARSTGETGVHHDKAHLPTK